MQAKLRMASSPLIMDNIIDHIHLTKLIYLPESYHFLEFLDAFSTPYGVNTNAYTISLAFQQDCFLKHPHSNVPTPCRGSTACINEPDGCHGLPHVVQEYDKLLSIGNKSIQYTQRLLLLHSQHAIKCIHSHAKHNPNARVYDVLSTSIMSYAVHVFMLHEWFSDSTT